MSDQRPRSAEDAPVGHHCCAGCDDKRHCTHGYETWASEKETIADQLRAGMDPHEVMNGVRARASAPPPGPDLREAHPDEPHEFRTVCQRCGENGYLHVAVITDLEVVKVEPRAALAATPRTEASDG